jgi:hypothetical protein
MRRVTRLTERDLTRIVKRVIMEQDEITCSCPELKKYMSDGLSLVKEKGYPVSVVGGSFTLVDEDTVIFKLPNGRTLTLNVTD